MARAGVFIGVDQTGNLQRLNDAAAGARRMYEWALAQGMPDGTHAKLITDADGKTVHPDHIYDAIKEIIDGPGVDQLVLYFAGHGVNISRNEHWLLTDAPVKASAAVNVSGSVELARYCGINHVVIFSDACRVAPEGLQAQNVRGVDVFPNEGAADRAKPVDQFFACYLGKTAAEIKDPASAASTYSALYTNALLDALSGRVLADAYPDLYTDALLDALNDQGRKVLEVRPRDLEKYLEAEVLARVRKMRLEGKVNQNPDAIITSDADWLARIAPDTSVHPGIRKAMAPPTIPMPAPNLQSVARDLVRSAVAGDKAALGTQLEAGRTARVAGGTLLVDTVEKIAAPFGPDHFETQCGIKVRGARMVEFYSPRAQAELLGTAGDVLRVDPTDGPAVSVLVTFDGGVGAVIPAIKGFIAALTFDDGDLVDVAYEPSANDWRWDMYKDSAARVRALRAVAASSSQHGRFRLDQDDAIKIAQDMQYAKGIDPTLAVYAAYAYHDLQAIERIRDMSGYLRDDIGVTFFDLALLSRNLLDKSVVASDRIVPFFPLLSQGWALLGANRVRLHPALQGIENNMRDSLWSLFDEAGLRKLAQAMHTGEVL